jgi:hypothetical protein
MARSLALEDFIFLPYVVAVVWQFFCFIPNLTVAWTFAILTSLAVWYAYLILRPPREPNLPRSFWAIVVIPLVVVYGLRALYPDISFDVLNYHIFHAERALRGPLLLPQDFFPTPAAFNPAPDILTGLYRHLLGYRLGTIPNFAVLVWLGIVLDRVLQAYIKRSWLRSVAVLTILCTEQVFFQINNYMVDLLALPLLLEAARLSLRKGERSALFRDAILVALLLGISVTFKLANVAFAAPIAVVFAVRAFENLSFNLVSWAKLIFVSVLVGVLPLLPFSIFIYRLTGNPFFPLYNAIFLSPYWPVTNVLDPRWGPHTLTEKFVWPVLIFFRPERFCEFPVYSGRMSLGVIAALACIPMAKNDRLIRGLAIMTLLGALLWSIASGYSRYAIFVEITSGILLVWIMLYLSKAFAVKSLGLISTGAVALVLLAQVTLTFGYAYRYEWSTRATLVDHRLRYTVTEARQLLRDRHLNDYLAPEDRTAMDDVGTWVETTYKTTALMALLKPNTPVIGARMQEYFVNPVGRERFDEMIASTQGRRLFTLTDAANLEGAREALSKRGLIVGSNRPLSVPFFSSSTKFDLLLVEVMPEPLDLSPPAKGKALRERGFNARIQVANAPLTMHPGEKSVLTVTLQNASRMAWPGQQPTWQYQITVGNRWLKPDGTKVNDVDGRTSLTQDLAPGNSATLRLQVSAPATAGDYVLELDVVQEGVAWFSDHGSPTFRANIKVN